MLARVLTILVAVPVILACVYFGGAALLFIILAAALVSINEFYYMMKIKGHRPAEWAGNVFTLLFIVSAYYAPKNDWAPMHSLILTGAALTTMLFILFKRRAEEAVADLSVTLLGMVYVGWFFSYLLFIRALDGRGLYLFFLLAAVWALDMAAYLVGMRFGKRRLFPSVSPKKSVEGAMGGFIGCLAAAGIFGYFAGFDMTHSLVLGVIIGVMAQLSDLVESLIKRYAGVKDSSHLLPGHGGLLDRADSFILTAPVVYYYLVWVILR